MPLKIITMANLATPEESVSQEVEIDTLSAVQTASVERNIHAKSSEDPLIIPIATADKVGGITAETKDSTYTDAVKIDSTSGRIYTKHIATKVSELENDSNYATEAEVAAAVAVEAASRSSADSTLQTNITNEKTRASAAETALQANLTAEVNRAAGVEAGLVQSITNETTNRTSADNVLQQNINAEAVARQSADDTKVDKTSNANKVYGTDANGNQTTYDKNSFGQVEDVKFNGTSVVDSNKVAIIPNNISSYTNDSNYQTQTQVNSAINIHNTSTSAHSDIRQDITNIEALIPSQASATNQLGDKAFINSSIENMAAFRVKKRIGSGTQEDPYQYVSFNTKAELNSITTVYIDGVEKVPGKHDYAIVLADESKQGTAAQAPTTKYSYPKLNTEPYDPTAWEFDYIVNNTGFTAAQMAAVDSGITAAKVATYDNYSTSKQDTLSEGTGIDITNNVISVNDLPTEELAEDLTFTPTNTVGGCQKGTTYSNKSVKQLLEQILCPYVAFTFNSISTTPGATTYEYGSAKTVTKVTPSFTAGSRAINSVKIGSASGASDLYEGTTATSGSAITLTTSKSLDGLSNATIYCTLSDGNTTTTKSATFTFSKYNYYTVTNSTTPPTSGGTVIGTGTQANITTTANTYIWFICPTAKTKIQQYSMSMWNDMTTTAGGTVTFTTSTGQQLTYYTYRTDMMVASTGTYRIQ